MIEPSVDPTVTAKPARVVCTLPGGRLESNGPIRLVGNDGNAEVPIRKGDDLADIADAVNRFRNTTGVVAEIPATVDAKGKARPDKTLVLTSEKTGAVNFVRVELPDSLQTVGGSHQAEEHGTDKLESGASLPDPRRAAFRLDMGLLPAGEHAGLRRFFDCGRGGNEQSVLADAARTFPRRGGRVAGDFPDGGLSFGVRSGLGRAGATGFTPGP